MFRACIFDLDGTLVDSLEDLTLSVNHVLAEWGESTHTKEEYRRLVGRGIGQMIEDAVPESVRTPEVVAELRDRFERHYWDHCLDHTRPYDGIDELLSQLADTKCAVVTNKPDAYAKKIVSALFGDCFDVVIGQRAGVPHKPDPASALAASAELEVPASECLYLGDSDVDMLTARAAGMFAVGALWGFRSRKELLGAGAQALAETPAEVLAIMRNTTT